MVEGSQIPTGATALLPSRFAFLSVCMKIASVLLGNTAGDPPQKRNAGELSTVALLSMGTSFSGLLSCALGTRSAVQLETEHVSQISMGYAAHKVCLRAELLLSCT